ncbi:MAG: helix-turn-helix domain-containing protein [Verrucomicrobiales bacterium]|nr:helix-turn-helix domain-containing protein [Verrucomicrobiales bacterium]
MSWYGYKPYVSVAQRKANALKEMEKLRKQGKVIQPVEIQGLKIAKQFWGKAWCEHLESFGDFENRIPRGRTYVRNGSVCHLDIQKGTVTACVAGSELYEVEITINPLSKKKWKTVKQGCTNQVSSLLDLLQGRIPEGVLETVTNQNEGLFPTPKEIQFECDCPDYAYMCKHIAAVLYGIGARFDKSPELLFELRGVDVEELIDSDAEIASATGGGGKRNRISLAGLDDVFGIEIDGEEEDAIVTPKPRKKKKAALTGKKARPGKAVAKKKAPRRRSASGGEGTFTAPDVIELRDRFDMSQTEFAKLLGVSKAAVSGWENKPGEFRMRANTLQEFKRVKRLSRKKAREEIEK